jgi:hypothetical protein
MSQRERLPRVAVGFAAVALATAAAAVIVLWRTDRLQSGTSALPSRHVSASDLIKLRPGAVVQVDGGVRVADTALCAALGLSPSDTITAISGHGVTRVHELSGILHELAIFRPHSLFIDLIRDRAPVVERWELDGDLDVARRAELAASGSGASDPRIATVAQIDGTTYGVPRATVEAWTAEPSLVTSGGRAIPMFGARDQEGFKLYAIRPGSAYAALGLEDGDVVRAINGTPIGSGDQILELVARSTTQITVDVLRRGQSLLLNYLIK